MSWAGLFWDIMGFERWIQGILNCVAVMTILALACVSAIAADPTVGRESAPSWFEQVPLPEFDPSKSAKNLYGTAWLLTDNQVRHQLGGYDFVQRHAYKIIDRVGLEDGAKFQFSFDPSYQSAAVNSISLIHNGVRKQLRDEALVNVYRSESNDYLGILTGRLTANVLMPKVQVGDVIDYVYTVKSGGSLGAALYDDFFPVEYESSISLVRKKIDWPADKPLRVRTLGSAPPPAVSEAGGYKTYLWEVKEPKPAKVESSLPSGIPGLNSVEVASVADWGSLADALQPHYQSEANLPADFRGRLDEIAAKWPLKPDRMTEALRLVEDEIRYVSLSIGEGALIPRRPDEVLRTGFGDCKDKSLLLVSALRHLGIDSGLALARLGGNEILKESLPALRAFDHAIAYARIDGKTFWMDPTDSQQGGRGFAIVEPDYGYALPLEPGSKDLVKMSSAPTLLPDRITREEFVLPAASGDPLLLTVFTTYLREEADYYRKRLANDGDDAIAKKYLDYYAGKFTRMEERENISIKDNREANVVTVVEKYILKNPQLSESGLGKEFPVKGDIGLPSTADISAEGRHKPFDAGRPFSKRHIVNVKNLKANFRGPDMPKDFERWFAYDINSSSTATEFTVEWQLRGKAGIIPASELKSYSEAIHEISESSDRLYDFLYDENADTEDSRYERFKEYLALFFGAIGLVFILWKLFQRYAPADPTLFLPVGMVKLFVMYNLTGGLYGIYWAWMSVRHHRGGKRFDLIAFLSGFFFPLASLFMAWRVRGMVPAYRALATLIMILFAFYSSYYLYELYGSFILDRPERANSVAIAITFAESVALLPAAHLVNRANQIAHETNSAYRAFSEWDILAIMVTGFIYFCVLVG